MATAGALFMYLADEIGEQAWLTQVDLASRSFSMTTAPPGPCVIRSHHVFRQRIHLGRIGLVTALVLAFQRRWSLLLGWAVALIGAGELNVILKGIFRRLRPQLPDPWVTPSGWSFPSGHAMGSFVTYGFLAYLLTRVPRADFPRRTAVAVLAVLVLLIGFSRIYLGAHYLSDVIGGYAAAAVWLTFCILVTDRTQRR
jgi:Membrane-associated phospholipid phosphatase